jgi:peptidoglycan/LPS O-acetylase OafA/YrhL
MLTRRIGYVDGLRAIAVLGVLAYHSALHSSGVASFHSVPASPMMLFFRQGCHGVDLFFVLSGFCLSYPALQRLRASRSTDFDTAGYLAKRFVRIVPPYYAAIALFVLLLMLLPRLGLSLPIPPTQPFAWLGVVENALFLDGNGQYLNGSFWTLAVEFRWYFLFPIALWLWTRSPRAFLLGLGLAMLGLVTRLNSIDLMALPAFMLGIVAADLHIRDSRLSRLALPAFLFVLFWAVATTRYDWMNPPSLLWQLSSFLFVVAAGATPWISRLLSLRFLTFVGIASYSIYLVHEPIVVLLQLHGINPLLASACALAAGVIFWAIAERPVVETALRAKLIAQFEFLPRWFAAVGIGDSLHLEEHGRRTVPARVPPRTAAPVLSTIPVETTLVARSAGDAT